jgi:PTH1 family peptidyl-tRNA hydrolase
MLAAVADALPFALAGDDERYQAEVMRLAPAPKFSPRQAARGDD